LETAAKIASQTVNPGSSACGERQKGGPQEPTGGTAGDVFASRCIGRSRGGLTTKIHAVVDANGNPITLKLQRARLAAMADVIGSQKLPVSISLQQARFERARRFWAASAVASPTRRMCNLLSR
jgi:hypothetical protein